MLQPRSPVQAVVTRMSVPSSSSSMFAGVAVSAFHSHVDWLSRPLPAYGGADGFDVELDALHTLQSSPSALAAVYTPTAAEQHKNRYCDVLPNSASRVRLLTFEGCYHSDYVNASLVRPDLFSFPAYPYIAAQAPLAACVADFWYMVWEQRSELVVMLTKERERAKDDAVIRKADRYWPSSSEHSLTFGAVTVALIHSIALDEQRIQHIQRADATAASLTALLSDCKQTEPTASASSSSSSTTSSLLPSPSSAAPAAPACTIVVRELELSVGSERRTVRQLHYIGWPDHGVPSDLASFDSLLQLYRSLRAVTPRTAPIVVHCSAGIGRTGTFCTIDLALDQIAHSSSHHTTRQQRSNSEADTGRDGLTTTQPTAPQPQPLLATPRAAVSVANIVRLLRVSRAGMVQTKGQYQFCYRFIDYHIAHHAHSHDTQLARQVDSEALPTDNGHSSPSGRH